MARRKRSVVDQLILGPGWVSLVLAAIAYVVLGTVAPTLAPLVCFLLVAFAVISALRAWANRRMLDRQTGINSLRALPWKHFEDLLGEAYRRHGYKVTENLGGGADGGVDLVLRRDGKVTLVQCKRWRGKPVPVQTVRELFGILTDRRASAAKLVATTKFTADAIAFAKGKPIELVDSDALLQLVGAVQRSRTIPPPLPQTVQSVEGAPLSATTPACPFCGSAMIIRTARRGANPGSKFWGCSRYSAGCRGTRAC